MSINRLPDLKQAHLPSVQWVETLVDCTHTTGIYTYQIPPHLSIQPGDILRVPFGTQRLGAIALRLLNQSPSNLELQKIRPVEAVISPRFFSPQYWHLLHQVAQYYQTPLMQVIRTALPTGLLGKSQHRLQLCTDKVQIESVSQLSTSAKAVLTQLQQSKTGSYSWQFLQQRIKGAKQGIAQLQRWGWVTSYVEPPRSIRPKTKQAISLTAPDDQQSEAKLTPRQREILTTLQKQTGNLWLQDAVRTCKTSTSTLQNLAKKGYLVIQSREILRQEKHSHLPDQPKQMNAAQTQVLKTIQQQSGFAKFLLHGVTGSGKTEVYLQAITPILQKNRSVLVLVPEIGLTPQLTDRFRARFGDQVRVYHSALSIGERYDAWRQMLRPDPQVIIGTRSAIFAPLPNLGLIILDEEHDSSFKQDQPAPCYHARTIATWRASQEACPLILGSATPALETWSETITEPDNQPRETHHILHQEKHGEDSGRKNPPAHSEQWDLQATKQLNPSGKRTIPTIYLSLPERIHQRPMPPIQVVDMRQEFQSGNRSIFSRALQKALNDLQTNQQQGLLFIHRRGHSTFVSCRSCGDVLGCPHCDVSLAYHHPNPSSAPTLRCHYCNYGRSHPSRCPTCGSPYLKQFGSGTQRVIQDLNQQLPHLRCLRFDSDTTRNKGAHRHLLNQFAQGDADVLVGTQMLTKGIDLPQVTLVGILAADGLLHMSDYRASERAFQTLLQASGRAGRGQNPGQVILQTYTPDHPVIEAVQQQDYASFAANEVLKRSPLNYPPLGQLILLRLSSPDPNAVRTSANHMIHLLSTRLGIQPIEANNSSLSATESSTSSPPDSSLQFLGPVPAPVLKVARRYRWHILVKVPRSNTPPPDLTFLHNHCSNGVHLTIDVDPLNMA